jgi:formylglycine-generating enzyme required for sulfatase activity
VLPETCLNANPSFRCVLLLAILSATSVWPVQGQSKVAWTIHPAYETAQEPQTSTAFKILDEKGGEHTLYSESHAILVFEGNYRTGGWQSVAEPAKKNENLLRTALERRGFHVLVWRDLTGAQLRTTLDEVFKAYGYRGNSRLFFYYYGHGELIERDPDPNGPRAFLVPIDAPNPVEHEQEFYQVGFPISQIVEFAKEITVKHAFFAFEACRAGYLFATLSPPGLPHPLGYLFSKKIEVPVRQFLTAGSADEDVLASSPFTPLLVGAFQDGDLNHDGYVTGSEVLAYVSQHMPQATKSQNPQYGTIPVSGGGDIVIGPVDPSNPGAPAGIQQVVNAPKRAVVPTIQDFEDAESVFPPDRCLHNPGDTKTDFGVTYVWIPGGTFMMGCSQGDEECEADAEGRLHKKNVPGFWMAQTEMTRGQYKRFRPKDVSPDTGDNNLPMVSISWYEARAYCQSRPNGDLPTEVEWEYAARAGTQTSRYDNLDTIAWYQGNSEGHLHDVGLKLENRLHLYDMLGNAWEWTRDWYNPEWRRGPDAMDENNIYGSPDAYRRDYGRIARGGSYSNIARWTRASNPNRQDPYSRFGNIGFRCVQECTKP